MRLGDHLVEFRNRFIVTAIAVVLGMVVGWFFTMPMLDVLRQPIESLQSFREGRVSINFTNVTTAFDLRLQMALTIGIVLAAPVILYELWMFLMPGLRKGERRYAMGFLTAAIPLFAAGVGIGFYLMPHIVEVMTSFAPVEDTVFYDAKTYYSFVMTLCISTGVAFVIPVVLVMLNLAGVMTGRAILKGWRMAVILITLFSAFATPSADVLSMFLLAVPMVVLYFLAVSIALIVDRRRARRQPQEYL